MQLSGGGGTGEVCTWHSAVPRELGTSVQIYENSHKHQKPTNNEERAVDDNEHTLTDPYELSNRKAQDVSPF